MTTFDQFWRENSNISNLLPLKIVNFDTKIKIDHFQAFQEFVVFGQKWTFLHTVALSDNWDFDKIDLLMRFIKHLFSREFFDSWCETNELSRLLIIIPLELRKKGSPRVSKVIVLHNLLSTSLTNLAPK